MNGIIIAAIVILTVGLIGISFGMLRIHWVLEVINGHHEAIKKAQKDLEILRADLEDLVTLANNLKIDMKQTKKQANADIANLTKKIYGTADVVEFNRVKTVAYAADMKIRSIEKVIQTMNGRNITPRPRKSIQKGLMTVAVADDEKALDAEVRNSDG